VRIFDFTRGNFFPPIGEFYAAAETAYVENLVESVINSVTDGHALTRENVNNVENYSA